MKWLHINRKTVNQAPYILQSRMFIRNSHFSVTGLAEVKPQVRNVDQAYQISFCKSDKRDWFTSNSLKIVHYEILLIYFQK